MPSKTSLAMYDSPMNTRELEDEFGVGPTSLDDYAQARVSNLER